MQQKRSILWTVAAISWGAIFTILLLMPPPDLDHVSTIPHQDKLIHLGIFGLWTVLLLMADGSKTKQPNYLKVGFIAVIYGVITELLQLLTDDRSGDILDALADVVGVLIALYLYRLLYPRLKEMIY